LAAELEFASSRPAPALTSHRAPLLEYGWKFIDHEVAKTGERFGWW
jgi:hypothetical protein